MRPTRPPEKQRLLFRVRCQCAGESLGNPIEAVLDDTFCCCLRFLVSVLVSFASVRTCSRRTAQLPEASSHTMPTSLERTAADLESV